MQTVNLFWKLAVEDLGALGHLQLPAEAQQLKEIEEPHITLLYFGGRDEKKAARKEGISLMEFEHMNLVLATRQGEQVSFAANGVVVHPAVVFATVSLPSDLPCSNSQPFLKLRASPEASGSIVRTLLEHSPCLTGSETALKLPGPVVLSGRIEMETASPLLCQIRREPRLPDEHQGAWVYVKKHSSLCCAIVHFPSSRVRDAAMDCAPAAACRTYPLITFDMKPHHETLDGDKKEVPDAMFIAWDKNGGCGSGSRKYSITGSDLTARDLQVLFDMVTEPFMTSCPHRGADLLDDLLHSKYPGGTASGTGSSSEEVVVVRLTRMVRSSKVTNLLLQSPILEPCRLRVQAAGGDIMPSWAAGAKIFVPRIQPHELAEAGVKLQDHHLVVYRSDVDLLQAALAEIPCRQRPKLSQEQHMGKRKDQAEEEPSFVVVCTLRTNSSLGPDSSNGL